MPGNPGIYAAINLGQARHLPFDWATTVHAVRLAHRDGAWEPHESELPRTMGNLLLDP
jgi:hypothetical protein